MIKKAVTRKKNLSDKTSENNFSTIMNAMENVNINVKI